MIIEIDLVKVDDESTEKTKNFVLQLRSFEDEGVIFEVPEGYIGSLDDVYTNENNIPYEDLEPGRYVFTNGWIYTL